MSDLFKNLSKKEKEMIVEKNQPDWIDPMLATLTDDRFSDEHWIFERKFDGERCLAFKSAYQIRLMSRNQKMINNQYPELVNAFKDQSRKNFIVDGEIIAFEGNISSFAKLQKRMHVEDPDESLLSDVKVFFYLFDIMYVDMYDVENLSLRSRKSLLKKALDFDDPLRFTTHRNKEGKSYFNEACKNGWEGIIAKAAESTYVHSRSRKWLKFKCVNQQELIICGYTEPEGERIRFGALLLGYYDKGILKYAGKVGTGFDDETLDRLGDKLENLEKKESPFEEQIDEKKIHWTEPKLVAEIGFEEWTQKGKLRHPRYLGLRKDKDAGNVVREEPEN